MQFKIKKYNIHRLTIMKTRKLSESIKKIVASEQQWKCANCLKTLPSSYQVDHKIPFSICGNDNKENLAALCPDCHSLKTQPELKRISLFKKLREFCKDQELCWYCLEIKSDYVYHKCNEVIKDIDLFIKKYKSVIESFEELCEKYTYIPEVIQKEHTINKLKKVICKKQKVEVEFEIEIEDTLSSLTLSPNSLTVKINRNYMYIGNYFCKITESTTPNDIVDAINVCYENNPKKYDKLEIFINIDNKDIDASTECGNYLLEILPTLLDKNIFPKIEYNI
jgi:hypothetical protein